MGHLAANMSSMFGPQQVQLHPAWADEPGRCSFISSCISRKQGAGGMAPFSGSLLQQALPFANSITVCIGGEQTGHLCGLPM